MSETQETFLTMTKTQFDAGFKVLEAMAEGMRRICEAQLEAAVEAHASAEATRKQLAKARDLQDVWRIESEYLQGCVSDSLACCGRLRDAALETQANVAQCVPGARAAK